MAEEIEGEKILCSGHYISRPFPCLRHQGHHGKCITIKRGKCRVEVPIRWKK